MYRKVIINHNQVIIKCQEAKISNFSSNLYNYKKKLNNNLDLNPNNKGILKINNFQKTLIKINNQIRKIKFYIKKKNQ